MNLDVLFPYVLPEVIGCPDPLVRAALVMAANEFCRETRAWTEIQDPVALVDGEAFYDIDVPSQSYLHAVLDVWLGNRRLVPKTMLAMQDAMPQWATASSNKPVYYNSATERGQIRVFPTPANSTGSLVIRAVYAPSISATTLPDFLGQRYPDVIASGAKARLMLVPSQPWSNPQLAGFYQQRFQDGIVSARIDEAHDRTPGTITVRPRAFGF